MGRVADLFKDAEGNKDKPGPGAPAPEQSVNGEQQPPPGAGAKRSQPPSKTAWLHGPSYQHSTLPHRDETPA